MNPTRVVVADDSELARAATMSILSLDKNFSVVAEAVDGYDVLDQVEKYEPDLVLMDLNMPQCDGLLATRLIKRRLPHIAVVILTVSNDVSDLFAAIQSGAQGYLVKNLNPEDWLQYLRGLVRETGHLPTELARRMLAEFQPGNIATNMAPVHTQLTEREQEVFGLVAQAYTDRQIAERLHISLFTVKNHIRNIREKVGAANRVELALRARGQSELQ